jgi:hypothetical protein
VCDDVLLLWQRTDQSCHCRNIVTHHAEDGSGVGSAIIAGESSNASLVDHNVTTGFTADDFLFRHVAMTKARKDAGQYTNL